MAVPQLQTEDGEEFSVETRDVSPSHLLVKIESFSLLSQYGIQKYESRKVRRFHAMMKRWGFSKLISKKRLTDVSNGYLVNDSCVFGAEVFVIKSQQVIECVSLREVTHPYKRDWEISEFSKQENVWISEEFAVGDHQWKIKVYPNGNAREQGRSVSMYLECVESKSFASHEKVKADFRLRVKKRLPAAAHGSTKLSHWFASSEQDWGLSAFIPLADICDPTKGFLVDDCFSFEIEISVQAVVRDRTI